MNSNNSSQIDNVKTFSDDQCFPVTGYEGEEALP